MLTLANPFVAALTSTLIASLWQGVLIASAIFVCLKFAPRVSAASRFAAWASGFVIAASLPLLAMTARFSGTGVNQGSTAFGTAQAADGHLLQLDLRWGVVILGFWMAAAGFRLAGLAVHSLRLRKLWTSAAPIDCSERLTGLLADSGRGRVRVCSTKMLERPSVIGFFAPRILIPDWLLQRLTESELQQIVLHEAEHLRRRDDWTNLAQKMLMVVFPLNPALWWIERQLCREREMACDEGVVRLTKTPRAYAACLASLAERRLQRRSEALTLGAWQRRSELVHRVHRILHGKQTVRPIASAALLGTLGCGLVAGSLELARCPQLVTFVQTRPVETAQTVAFAEEKNAVAGSLQGDAVINDKRGLAAGFHMVEAKAVTPQRKAKSNIRHAQPEGSGSKLVKEDSPETPVVARENRAGMKQGEVQQWIVFTSVEQVGAVTRRSQLTADFDSTTGGDAVMRDAADSAMLDELRRQAMQDDLRGQIEITRLIMRMLPQGPLPVQQPRLGTFRDGWFVIQL
jgi:beta-lactamase regulating signal transducer with metallopeptidase domain